MNKKIITVLASVLLTTSILAQKTDSTKKDSIKAETISDTTTVFLLGKLSDFNLLYLDIQSPDDVSKNSKTELLNWIKTYLRPLNTPKAISKNKSK